MKRADLPGAVVLSLDFELAWGVRDRLDPQGPYRRDLLGARRAIRALLELFEEYRISATWAVVGFLFASSREQLERASPARRPNYADPTLDPYQEQVGENEKEDPLHFAASLIDAIRGASTQEIATHTFSHFYCMEDGQTRDDFRADLLAARDIAEKRGVRLRSIVFPRNQHNPLYDDILLENGITAYRGNPTGWSWRFSNGRESRDHVKRGIRLLDAYLNVTGPATTTWGEVLQPSGLSDVRASRLLRPLDPRLKALESARLRRIHGSIRHAAVNREIFHLWWHPHNFGRNTDENLDFLRRILDEVARCRDKHDLASLSMKEVDGLARGTAEHGRGVDAAILSTDPRMSIGTASRLQHRDPRVLS